MDSPNMEIVLSKIFHVEKNFYFEDLIKTMRYGNA